MNRDGRSEQNFYYSRMPSVGIAHCPQSCIHPLRTDVVTVSSWIVSTIVFFLMLHKCQSDGISVH